MSLLICIFVILSPVQKLFSADKAYVIDKLRVGIYEEKNLNSAIVKIISTGTELEIIEKNEQLALVIDPTGAKGWIDRSYLMSEPTSEIILKGLRTIQVTEPRQNPNNSTSKNTLTTLTKDNTKLKTKLADILPKAKKCESKLSILEKESNQIRQELNTKCPSPDSSLAEIRKEYTDIKAELENANTQIQKQKTKKDVTPASDLSLMLARHWLQLMITMVLMGVSFGTGGYMMDVIHRKRHGGYRL